MFFFLFFLVYVRVCFSVGVRTYNSFPFFLREFSMRPFCVSGYLFWGYERGQGGFVLDG